MGEGVTLPPPSGAGVLSMEETQELWDCFHEGGVPLCPRDKRALALSVDGANAYRLVCTTCGVASTWFEVTPGGLRNRTVPPPPLLPIPEPQ